SGDSAPWATISCKATDLPPPGSPPMSMFRSASVTSTWRPSSSVPRWTGSQIDSGATGILSATIATHLPVEPGGGSGHQDEEGFATVGKHRPAAGRAGLVGDRCQPGKQFLLDEALVTQ